MAVPYWLLEALTLSKHSSIQLIIRPLRNNTDSQTSSEQLRGYYTKYDCSSADLNPIGGISKKDLGRFILWAKTDFDLPILEDFISAGK